MANYNYHYGVHHSAESSAGTDPILTRCDSLSDMAQMGDSGARFWEALSLSRLSQLALRPSPSRNNVIRSATASLSSFVVTTMLYSIVRIPAL